MADAIVGLGTNLGDRLRHLRRAVRALRELGPSLRVREISPIYESDALVPERAPESWRRPYLNLAVRVEWDGDPRPLLTLLKSVEGRLGRGPRERWGPREIDLDLLAFGDLVVADSDLVLPHPGLAERPFALLPLADVAPGWRFPRGLAELSGTTAQQAAARWTGTPDHVPLRTRRTFHHLTEIVGVVNITPDSFSDGSRFLEHRAATKHARELARAGATVLDLGAESTRPGAAPVGEEEEWARLEPVLATLRDPAAFLVGADGAEGSRPLLSVDTHHAGTARRAIALGADWINDVTGLRDDAMAAAVAEGQVDVVLMHSLTVPPSPGETLPTTEDPVRQLLDWGERRVAELEARGVGRARIVFDPGIGFGKTAEQSVEIVRRADALSGLGVRVMVGHSRKSFLATWYPPGSTGAEIPAARDPETVLVSARLAALGVDYLRVHDVAGTARALRADAFVGPGVRIGARR